MLSSSLGGNLLPDRLIDQIAEARCLFDPRAGAGAEVQPHLAAVGSGEEVLAEPREQQKPGGACARNAGTKMNRR